MCADRESQDTPEPDDAVCGGVGDPRQPGDGVITWNQDPTPGTFDGDAPFDDKNWMAAGPRPDGVEPVCFSPITRTPTRCERGVVGSDRLHATWTRFDTQGCDEPNEFEVPCEGRIWHSYSDDQARSWSPAKPISGTAAFCIGIGPLGDDVCDDNQFSVPTVHPRTGLLGVAFQNFNTAGENQYLFVRSRNGGQTFSGAVLRLAGVRRQLPAGRDPAGLRRTRPVGGPRGAHEQLLPRERGRKRRRGQARERA